MSSDEYESDDDGNTVKNGQSGKNNISMKKSNSSFGYKFSEKNNRKSGDRSQRSDGTGVKASDKQKGV